MVNLDVATITGEETVLEQAAVEAFKTSLRGELLCPDDAGYEDARKVYKGKGILECIASPYLWRCVRQFHDGGGSRMRSGYLSRQLRASSCD
jgi:hypothetical protein